MGHRIITLASSRLFSGLCLFALLAAFDSANADGKSTCKLNGSWYGYLPTFQIDFVGTAHGSNPSGGTYVLEVPGLNPGLVGFPDAVKASTFRGTWSKIDNWSVAFSVVGYAVDTAGQTVFIAKISGIDTFSKDCNSINIKNTIEFFAPGQDPFGVEEPAYGWIIAAPHSASRARVDPPRTS